MNLLDGIVNAIFGPDTSQMSEQDRNAVEQSRSAHRKKAQEMAFSASQDPGEDFMRPETSVGTGGDLMDTIKKVMSLFK